MTLDKKGKWKQFFPHHSFVSCHCKNRFKEGSPALLIITCQLGKRKLEINDSLAYLQEPKNGDENEDEDEDENRIN